MFAIQGSRLSRSYGAFRALDDVEIAVPTGEIRGVIGPNGAGKSTLMDVLSGRARGAGLGQVMLNGTDVSAMSPQQRRRLGLARSFQRTNIFPELQVAEQLRIANHYANEQNVEDVMRELGLLHLAGQIASSIAYGDQRRLDLALALVGRPKVLLLDEPAAGLTMGESMALAEHLKDIVRRWNVAVLLVEHDMEVVFSICDRITVLNLGRILAEGTPREVREEPAVVTAYLGSAA